MDTASDRLEKYTANAREIVRTVLGINFDDSVWQLPYSRNHLKGQKKLDWKGIPTDLTRLGKAVVANESLPNRSKGQIGTSQFRLVFRHLGQILGERDVTTLTRKDFDLTARALADRKPQLSATTLAKYAGDLKTLVNMCNLRRLTETRIEWSNPFTRPDKGEREHLIPPEVFKAFGEIRSTVLATDDNDLDRLLVQLGEAGLEVSQPDDILSDSEKLKLLAHLRQSHGKEKGGADQDFEEAARKAPFKVCIGNANTLVLYREHDIAGLAVQCDSNHTICR